MICKKCANMFDDELSSCPECGTEVFADKGAKPKFTLNMTEEDLNKLVFSEVQSELTQETSGGDAKEENELPDAVPPEYEVEQTEKEPETTQKVQTEEAKTEEAPEKETVEKPKAKKVKTKMDPESKPAATLIISIMCILAVMMGILTFVSLTTDAFEADNTVRTMALSGLSTEDTGKLEEVLSTVGIISEREFDCEKSTVQELLSLVKPYDANGLYAKLYGTAQKTANTPDPAVRLTNENGDFIYYKIAEDEIDAIVEKFSLTVNHTVNCDDYYYYDGFYYFAEKTQYEPETSYVVDISESKQIQDGRYYVEASVLKENNLSEDNRERYAIVSKETDGSFKICSVSSTPLFDEEGIMIKAEDELSFTKKSTVIEAVADDGTVYHRYIVEYPLFSGDTLGEKTANQLHSDMLAAFEAEKETAQQDYEEYLKDGGEKDELPYITHVVSRLTSNSGDYIGIVEDTAEYVPASMLKAKEDAGTEETDTVETESEELPEPVELPERYIEGYNFEVETGDFVKKDNFIGKDYQTVSELLYRIYGGYGYDDIIAELNGEEAQNSGYIYGETVEEIPDDTENIGRKIYESASAVCQAGYLFCYVDEKGSAHDVVIPDEVIEKTLS